MRSPPPTELTPVTVDLERHATPASTASPSRVAPDDQASEHELPSARSDEWVGTLHQNAAERRASVVRKPPPVKFGAIDVGTNSIHLVMAEISPEGDFRILGRDKEMVQIGKGGFARHMLTMRAMNQGLAALKRFTKMAQLKGITRLKAVATSAVREARNGGDFVRRVREELNLPLHLVSAEQEARLIYLAVRNAVNLGDRDNLIVDVGGGSVELIVGNAERPSLLSSVKLGASRLSELFIHSDPPVSSELKALRRHIDEQLAPLVARVGSRRFAQCIATSGTVQNLATICSYHDGATEIESFNELLIQREQLKSLTADLAEMPLAQRMKLPGMDAHRVDSVLPAATLTLSLMRSLDIAEMRYCDMALREGVILDHISRNRAVLLARATWPDPRTRSVIQLAERCGYRQDHTEQVSRLTLQLYDQLQELHGLDGYYRALLRHACLLHDIGYLISHENHHKHSYYLIRNGGLQGFTEQEIEIIANIARYHRKSRPRKSHYSYQNLAKPHRPAVRKLVALLRLANALDRTHYAVIDSLAARIRRDRVDLYVHTDKDAELELWTARRQTAFFDREFGRPIHLIPAGSDAT